GARLCEEGGAPLRRLGLGARALLLHEPGALVLDPLQRVGVPRDQGGEDDERRHHHEPHARRSVVVREALALQAQPAEQRKDPDSAGAILPGSVVATTPWVSRTSSWSMCRFQPRRCSLSVSRPTTETAHAHPWTARRVRGVPGPACISRSEAPARMKQKAALT